jgi:hypothetical protein
MPPARSCAARKPPLRADPGALDDLDGGHCVVLENDILVVDSRYVVKGRDDDPSDLRFVHIFGE